MIHDCVQKVTLSRTWCASRIFISSSRTFVIPHLHLMRLVRVYKIYIGRAGLNHSCLFFLNEVQRVQLALSYHLNWTDGIRVMINFFFPVAHCILDAFVYWINETSTIFSVFCSFSLPLSISRAHKRHIYLFKAKIIKNSENPMGANSFS